VPGIELARRAFPDRDVQTAAATFVCCWTILAVTAPGIPLVWDEPEYLARARNIVEWFRVFPNALSEEQLQKTYWLFIHFSEGHPAGFALPIALGQWLFSGIVDPLTAARLGPITLFSAACAVVALRLKNTYGTAAAIVAPVTLLTFPRVFSEAHFATQDGQLTAWWLVLWAVQSGPARGWRDTIRLGVVLGFTTATKFTGWLAWLPVAMSEVVRLWKGAVPLVRGSGPAILRLLIIMGVALLTFYIVNPSMWYGPLEGFRDHFHRSLNRGNTLNIATQFLGRAYKVTEPLPWYNTLVWLVFATPLPTLALGAVGLWHCLARPTAFSLTLILHWATLMVIRALPGAPPHDGIRLFLPAFGFWCVFAGIGAQRVFTLAATLRVTAWRLGLRFALCAALLASAVNLARYYPQTLSHYSILAGGLRGAVNKGMEPTYWWDALDNDVLQWLNMRAGRDDALAFSTIYNLGPLRDWGRLRAKNVNPETTPFKWYVLQNRPALFSRTDRYLMAREQPAYVKYAGRRRSGQAVPRDLDVPLISVFSFEQYQRARRRTAR
jgi:hypothetical protein